MKPLIPGFVFALASLAVAQSTHVVGPGGYADIGAALAVAGAGDLVLVHPGNYPGFTVHRGVTIRAVTNGTVWSTGVANVPAGETLHLVDLDLWRFTVTGGECSFDRCRLHLPSGATWTVLLYVADASVHLQQCQVGNPGAPYIGWGSLAGILATNSTVSAVDCSFRAPDAVTAIVPAPGGAAIHLIDSTFHGSRIVASGGDGRSTGPLPGPALRAVNSIAWIADSTLTGGQAWNEPGTPPWACPVDANAGRLARCTLLPASCAPPVVPMTGPLLAVHRVAPLLAGSSFQLDFRTEPNAYVGVFASFALATNTFAGLEQPTALEFGSLLALSVLVTDGAGNASGSWALPPGTANLTLWLQAVTPGPLPLQLSPVAGGVVR